MQILQIFPFVFESFSFQSLVTSNVRSFPDRFFCIDLFFFAFDLGAGQQAIRTWNNSNCIIFSAVVVGKRHQIGLKMEYNKMYQRIAKRIEWSEERKRIIAFCLNKITNPLELVSVAVFKCYFRWFFVRWHRHTVVENGKFVIKNFKKGNGACKKIQNGTRGVFDFFTLQN